MKKWIALVLALAMLFAFAAAETAQPAIEQTEVKETQLEYSGLNFDGLFNAFFAENPDDRLLADLTAATLLGTTPEGDIILDGVQGHTTSYKGVESTHYGVGSVQVVENVDGTADYQLTMREDVYFADGRQADIDDVIFTLYVLCDPSYDGPINLRHLPIRGIEAYAGTTAPLSELLIAAGRDNADFTLWDEATQAAFWADLDAAGTALAQEVVDFILANYLSDDYTAEIGKTAAEVAADPQLQLQLGMAMWGYGHAYTEDMTVAGYWQTMLDEYDGDVLLAAETESVGTGIFDFIEGYAEKYGGTVYVGDPVDSIEGVERTGDYSMTLHADAADESILYALAELPVMPLHYYGSEKLYNYESNAFGFEKGDLSPLHARDCEPLGCGEYAFSGYSDGLATLQANEYYFVGEAEYKLVLLSEN